jgi:branched-chain amino acid transport system permease protein
MPSVQLEPIRAHYEEAGAGRNVFVFVHGNFASSRWWRPVLDRVPAGWRAVAMDMRGCGETAPSSSGGAAQYSIPQVASDLGALVDRLDLPAFHLVGHSLGAAVALELALRRDERVRSLTLVAPPPAGGLSAMRKGHSRFARMLRSVEPGSPTSMLTLRESYRMQAMLGTNRMVLRRSLARMMPTADPHAVQFEALLDDAVRIPPEAVVGFLQALEAWNVEGTLGSFEVPTLILGGSRDVLVPARDLELLAREMRHGELAVWSGVGHSPQLERPDEFVASLIQWATRSRRTAWIRALRRLAGRFNAFRAPPSESSPAIS